MGGRAVLHASGPATAAAYLSRSHALPIRPGGPIGPIAVPFPSPIYPLGFCLIMCKTLKLVR
jgi:hypothetical protein